LRRVLLSVSLSIALLATRAEAQRVYFASPVGDTVLSVLTGDTGIVQLYLSAAGGVSAYDLTIFLDDARVHFVRADSGAGTGLPSPTIAIGSGQVNLSASGVGTTSSSPLLATLHFAMDAAAQNGSLLSLKLNTLTAGDGSTDLLPTMRSDVWDVCQAEQIWGDLDANRTVNSRDALIAITSAVGLPVGGFDVAMGDVDQDSVTTTRDALLILSYGIGLTTYTVAGVPRANRCAPLEPWPADVAMWTTGGVLSYVTSGDTNLQSVPFSGGYSSYAPSWAPDGSRLVVVKYIGTPYYYYDLVTTTLDGAEQDTLFVSTSEAEYTPAWSPDGTKIAFVRYLSPLYTLFVMNADGTNQTRLTGKSFADSIYVSTSGIAWSPDGSRIVFTGYHVTTGGNSRVWTINPDGSGIDSVTTVSSSSPVFSPSSDSIAYYSTSPGRVYVIQAAGDTGSVGGPASALYASQSYPLWVNNGIAFRSSRDYPYEFFLRTTVGRHLRLTRNLPDGVYASVRLPSVYVDAVTVSPAYDSLAVPGDTTTLLVSVLNSDATAHDPSIITWRSRNEAIAIVDSVTGLVTAADSGDVYIVGTAGGWRSDSTLISVLTPLAAPPAAAGAGRRR